MSRSKTHHWRQPIAISVVMALLFAPAVSRANCCCALARIGQSVGLAVSSCCEAADSAGQPAAGSCCRAGSVVAFDRVMEASERAVAQHGCCVQGSRLRSTDCGAATDSVAPVTDECALTPTGCQCSQHCCDRMDVVVAGTPVPTDNVRLIDDVCWGWPAYWMQVDHAPWASVVASEPPNHFLSASHRCATLCRWLN